MALCIVYSVVLERCSAVSTLLCGSHSSGHFTASLGISEQQLHMSHLFDQLQGHPQQRNLGRLPWQLVTLQHHQTVPGLALLLHHPSLLELLPLSEMGAQYHCRYFFISAEEAPEDLWRCGGVSRESLMLIYALLLG